MFWDAGADDVPGDMHGDGWDVCEFSRKRMEGSVSTCDGAGDE